MNSDAEIVEHARNCAMSLIEGPAHCTCRLVERRQAEEITRLTARVEELEREKEPLQKQRDEARVWLGILVTLADYLDAEEHDERVIVMDLPGGGTANLGLHVLWNIRSLLSTSAKKE